MSNIFDRHEKLRKQRQAENAQANNLIQTASSSTATKGERDAARRQLEILELANQQAINQSKKPK